MDVVERYIGAFFWTKVEVREAVDHDRFSFDTRDGRQSGEPTQYLTSTLCLLLW